MLDSLVTQSRVLDRKRTTVKVISQFLHLTKNTQGTLPVPAGRVHPNQRREKSSGLRCDAEEWAALDEDLDSILKAVQAGAVERKVEPLADITYNLGKKEHFGLAPGKENNRLDKWPNRRKRKFVRRRKEVKIPNKHFKKTSIGIKGGRSSEWREQKCQGQSPTSWRRGGGRLYPKSRTWHKSDRSGPPPRLV